MTHYRHSVTVDIGRSVKSRMRIATAAALLAALVGCGTYDGSADDEPTSAPSETAGPSKGASASAPVTNGVPEQAAALVGDWEDPDARWVVHFRADGTFVEDFEGVVDFRAGEYTLDGVTVALKGDDGNTDEGGVEGESLVFNLGTLERVAPTSSGQ